MAEAAEPVETPTATPAEGTVAVPSTDEETPLTKKGLKARLSDKKAKDKEKGEETWFSYMCCCCTAIVYIIVDIIRTIPVFTLSGLALCIIGIVMIRVNMEGFEQDVSLPSTTQ